MALPTSAPTVAERQGGVFSDRQARAQGYSRHRIQRLLRDGRWFVVLGSVFAEARSVLSSVSLAHAGILAVTCAGVVSHATAARLWGLVVPDDPEVHLIVGRDVRLHVRGLRPHRIELQDVECTVVAGALCTTLLRTVVDCLLWLPEEAGQALMADALRRRLLTVDDVRRTLSGMGQRHGLARAWRVLGDVGAGAHSDGEIRLHRVLRAAGVHGWTANTPVHDQDGLIGLADVLFEPERVIVELDGRAFHTDAVAFQRDRERQNRLVMAGYTVLRFTWHDVAQRPAAVVGQIRESLARARRASA
jgi:hypothetical protein